jgi:hypothetical protein
LQSFTGLTKKATKPEISLAFTKPSGSEFVRNIAIFLIFSIFFVSLRGAVNSYRLVIDDQVIDGLVGQVSNLSYEDQYLLVADKPSPRSSLCD